MSLPPSDDHSLLDRYRDSRCTESFQTIVTRHKGWIYALAKRHVKDKHLAEDVVQAVFIVLSRKAKTIPRTMPLTAWLFRVARFSSNDVVKRESRGRKRIDRVASNLRESSGSSNNQSDVDLDEAIACLPESDRQVILLRFYESKSMEEIGAVLGITAQAAKKRVSRSIQRLRDTLARKGHAMGAGAVLTMLLSTSREASAAEAIVTAATPSKASISIAQATLRGLRGARTRLLAALTGSAVVLVLGVNTISPVMGQIIQPVWQKIGSFFNWDFAPTIKSAPTTTAPEQQTVEAAHKPAEIWVGRAGNVAIPIAGPIAGEPPMSLHHLPIDKGAVAVIRDDAGNAWFRPIDEELLPPTLSGVESKSYEELNPHLTTLYERIAREVFDMAITPRHKDDTSEDWQPLNLRYGSDSSFDTQIQLVAEDGPSLKPGITPEPALLPLAAVGFGLLQRRRRRNSI